MASQEILLTSSTDSPITAYNTGNFATLARFSGSISPRQGLTLAGKGLIAASHVSPNTASSGFIHLFNWWGSAPFQCIRVPEPVAPVVSTPDGSYLFSGGLSGMVYIFALPSGDLYRSFQAHRGTVSCFAVDDGALLVSGGDDGEIIIFPILRLLDVSSDELLLYRFAAHSSAITCISFGGSSSIVSSSLDGTCKIWSVTDGAQLRTIRFLCPMWCVVVDPTTSVGYCGGADGHVYVIPMKYNQRRQRAEVAAWGPEDTGAVVAVAMVNENRNLLSASEEGIIRVWDVENGSIVRVLRQEGGGSISDILVANRFDNGRIKDGDDGISARGFCERELSRQVRDVGEMEEWLGGVVKDRRKAIDMLEVAIGTYERLLGLLLNEAKGGEGRQEESK